MLQKSGRRGRALRPCFCERNERRKKRRKAAGENVFHAGELVLPADRCARRKCRRFQQRLSHAARQNAGGLHGQVEEGAATSRSSLRTKRIFLRRRKNIPSGQGSGRDIFAERRAEPACLTGPRPKAADRCQRGDFAQSGETRMCLRMALRGGVASGFGESRTRGLV